MFGNNSTIVSFWRCCTLFMEKLLKTRHHNLMLLSPLPKQDMIISKEIFQSFKAAELWKTRYFCRRFNLPYAIVWVIIEQSFNNILEAIATSALRTFHKTIRWPISGYHLRPVAALFLAAEDLMVCSNIVVHCSLYTRRIILYIYVRWRHLVHYNKIKDR